MIIDGFENRHRDLWGSHTVRLRHTLADSTLFSDEALAGLLDRVDRQFLTISTMEQEIRDLGDWHYCDPGDLSGHEILDAVRRGRIWVNFTHVAQCDERFARLRDDMYAELEALQPGFRTFKRNIGLLISSPRVKVIYHADIQGQALWQLRGRKKIWIYPPVEPFLKQQEFEDVVRRVTEEDITYEDWFDDYAEVHELGPGDLLHWRLNGPHRVENLDSLNVSATTQHWTDDIRRSFAVHYGNGLIRDRLGYSPRSRRTSGPAFWAKAALATAWRMAGLQERQSYRRVLTYRVDPLAPGGVRPTPSSATPAVP